MSQPTVTRDPMTMTDPPVSPKSFVATWLFAWLLGGFGADRFYLGKIGTAVLKLVTLGGLGIWVLIDLILVLAGKTTDKQGRPLAGYDQRKKLAWIITGIAVILGGISGAVVGATTAATIAAISQANEQAPIDEAAAPADDTAAAKPADVFAWADEKYGTFEASAQSGTGDSVIALPADAASALVRASHQGTSNFMVQALDAQNQPTLDLLVNTIGAYSGITAYGLQGEASEPAVALQITADGPWTIEVGPMSFATELPASGMGDDVFLYNGDATTVALTHDGDGEFTVAEYTDIQYSGGGVGINYPVNQAGAYTGTVPLTTGPSVIAVTANGNWTVAQG